MHKSLLACAALATVALCAVVPAQAADSYPARTITIIIPTGPGGGTDTVIRKLADVAGKLMPQKFVILNRVGAGGLIGTSAIVRAEPDGYTLGGIWNAPLTMTPYTLSASYTPNDYVAVSLSDSSPIVLCSKPDFPAKDGKEFIEHLKKNPDKYTYGTDGVGATIQLASERIFSKLGVKVRSVPFSGAGETLANFLSGSIDIYGGSISPILPYVANKTAKCLIVTSAKRVPSLPSASSLTDLGIPDEATLLWHGIIAPKGVPADRIAFLEALFRKAAQTDEFKDYLAKQSVEVEGTSAADMRKRIDAEYAAMGRITQTLGLGKK